MFHLINNNIYLLNYKIISQLLVLNVASDSSHVSCNNFVLKWSTMNATIFNKCVARWQWLQTVLNVLQGLASL